MKELWVSDIWRNFGPCNVSRMSRTWTTANILHIAVWERFYQMNLNLVSRHLYSLPSAQFWHFLTFWSWFLRAGCVKGCVIYAKLSFFSWDSVESSIPFRDSARAQKYSRPRHVSCRPPATKTVWMMNYGMRESPESIKHNPDSGDDAW